MTSSIVREIINNNGDIKKYCANNYLLVIENTKLSLELLEIKKDGTKVEK